MSRTISSRPLCAGDIPCRALLQRRGQARDATGALLPPEWKDVGHIWCGIRFISASSLVVTAQDKTVSFYLLTLRKRRDVCVGDRIVSDGSAYHVLSIDNSMPDRTLLRTETDVIDDRCSN